MFKKLKQNMNHPINHLKNFARSEDGAEMLEIAIGFALAAIIIGVVTTIVTSVSKKMEGTETIIENTFSEVNTANGTVAGSLK